MYSRAFPALSAEIVKARSVKTRDVHSPQGSVCLGQRVNARWPFLSDGILKPREIAATRSDNGTAVLGKDVPGGTADPVSFYANRAREHRLGSASPRSGDSGPRRPMKIHGGRNGDLFHLCCHRAEPYFLHVRDILPE